MKKMVKKTKADFENIIKERNRKMTHYQILTNMQYCPGRAEAVKKAIEISGFSKFLTVGRPWKQGDRGMDAPNFGIWRERGPICDLSTFWRIFESLDTISKNIEYNSRHTWRVGYDY